MQYPLPLDRCSLDELAIVGGESASLGEMFVARFEVGAELAALLVHLGIASLSLAPDVIVPVLRRLGSEREQLKRPARTPLVNPR